jgi:hypothetical protein
MAIRLNQHRLILRQNFLQLLNKQLKNLLLQLKQQDLQRRPHRRQNQIRYFLNRRLHQQQQGIQQLGVQRQVSRPTQQA